MKITITFNDTILTLSNDELNSDHLVTLRLSDSEDTAIVSGDLPINELMPALIAFDSQRGRRLSEESKE